ncbi:NUDIX hydrolase [Dysgonomonas sp. 216]|uniref:NUDIX hydrolase n=1 Tax=Dysgonomonas sp. 216 TaxID=2302934 RepID=UPI0013D4CDD3|nr:NUDIX hydrolase [Dysgonomonas sp. 216]NDW19624.1 NUDIX hydrolase [Dysgonomonas sp. 216]
MKLEPTEDRKWKVLSSKYLSQKPWNTIREEHVLLPNGNEIPNYYVHEYPTWVNVIAITKNGEFVFVRQYRHGLGKTAFELCAGVGEEGEEPMFSAKRELIEETGYGGGEWSEFMVCAANPSTNTNLVYSYLATGVEVVSESNLEPSEDITVHLLSVEQVRELLLNDYILQSVMLAPLWKYFAQNKLL